MITLRDIEIVVLTRDRKNLLVEMIDSLLTVKNQFGNIWISDNSTNEETSDILREKYPYISCKKRANLSSFDHFKNVCSEITHEYCMILHDDDYMLPSMVDVIKSALKRLENFDAFGFNAKIEKDGVMIGEFLNSNSNYAAELSSNDIIISWLTGKPGHPPFPGFLYRTAALKVALELISRHSPSRVGDLLLIYIISKFGKVGYSNINIMVYRLHNSNDTHSINSYDWIKLKNSYIKVNKTNEAKIINLIRSKYIMKRFNWQQYPKSSLIIAKYVLYSFLKNPLQQTKIIGKKNLIRSFSLIIAKAYLH